MDRDFDHSIILGYGQTVKPRCEACSGNRRTPLRTRFAYHCRDLTTGKDYVAGPDCRTKIKGDTRRPDQMPHFGRARPEVEPSGREGAAPPPPPGMASAFEKAGETDRLCADMAAWVHLRQSLLPALGFRRISYDRLRRAHGVILQGRFNAEAALGVRQIYGSILRFHPEWSLDNLRDCYDAAMQIALLESKGALDTTGQIALYRVKQALLGSYTLSDALVLDLKHLAACSGEPAWTSRTKFADCRPPR